MSGGDIEVNVGIVYEDASDIQSFSEYFNNKCLTNNADETTLTCNSKAITSYITNQLSIDQLGDILIEESQHYNEIGYSFDTMDSLLSQLYTIGANAPEVDYGDPTPMYPTPTPSPTQG